MPYLEIFLLLLAVWLFGRFFKRIGWPAIFGEILAGILMGPVLLGVVHDSEYIKILAELGIFFLMFHAGLETSPSDLFKASKYSLLVALGGVILPFASGFLISKAFDFNSIESLFIGMGLSISSVAVSARIFKDCNILNSKAAHITLGAAIIDDILGLILFSIVLNIAENGSISINEISFLTARIIIFFALTLFIGQKFFTQLHKILYEGNKGFTFTIILALFFGILAEFMGIHVIIGAFMAGLFIKEEIIEKKLFSKIEDRIYGLSYSFLGPIFFASLAFHLDFKAILSLPLFTFSVVIIAVASKVLGAGLMTYLMGMKKIEALTVGLAMNSRGAVEMIIAVIGLEKNIISKEVFSILIIVAFVTTIISIITLKPVAKRL
ncbi:hypothetical protein A2483_01305 [Candidatus Peregrinibacteria bacterium RIFOXYC2_FULL_33_13]|nr:MAG: Sodium/hydrogen exchanger [Candidatus Peregrinibacteria bacterium GW2011_GWA2_33_10]KKP38995.1 MAG: sodium/hydrogen exchanger [Candidatus Peregrinibacteria bacterium GW2011_GWC2_33_13]OGJ49983.1 MAG: hypothetical protein A2229_02885 [Candidatus Peregrinibacteria bacterium RIFOXYA2_FULL_33_7]OGJ55393.1 MAG: hypothetical protein A2483_01305 [Candidatus Peregrinibacteria bacterium RIFOXYC2_FULL_33_13]